MKIQIKSHAVDGARITAVGPLIAAGKMVGPNAGLLLALENGQAQRWVAETDGYTPVVGDFFIVDADLKVSFIVPKEKYAELFADTV